MQDVHGNLVGESAGEVELAVTPAGLVSLDAVIDHGDGTYTATLTAGTTAGIVTIAGTLAAASRRGDADVGAPPARVSDHDHDHGRSRRNDGRRRLHLAGDGGGPQCGR